MKNLIAAAMHVAQGAMSDEDALESLQDRLELGSLRERMETSLHRARRQFVRDLPKRHCLMGNVIAPGVPTPVF